MKLSVRVERFPIRGTFRIARGAKTEAVVVVAELERDGAVGRGECVPYARYGETVEGVAALLRAQERAVSASLDRAGLQALLPAGAARNALDCALWDLEAKCQGRRVWELAGLPAPHPVTTAFTLSVDAPAAMAEAARAVRTLPLLKLKMAGDDVDLDRVKAVRDGAPAARLVVDANEAWNIGRLRRLAPSLAALGVELIEQPLPAAADAELEGFASPVPLCADESCHDAASLAGLAGRYAMVNIKLDKTGGLTEAFRVCRLARQAGLGVMVGCMVSTSLAIAPALLIAQQASVADLDGPLLLDRDRDGGLAFAGALAHPPEPGLWG